MWPLIVLQLQESHRILQAIPSPLPRVLTWPLSWTQGKSCLFTAILSWQFAALCEMLLASTDQHRHNQAATFGVQRRLPRMS